MVFATGTSVFGGSSSRLALTLGCRVSSDTDFFSKGGLFFDTGFVSGDALRTALPHPAQNFAPSFKGLPQFVEFAHLITPFLMINCDFILTNH